MSTHLRFTTADGVSLEAELALPSAGAPPVGVVLCHPHPLFGGSMRVGIIGPLFDAFAAAGTAVLRFNFRGVDGGEGAHDHGRAEQLDVTAAIDALVDAIGPDVPVVLVGWSFGGNLALSVDDPRVTAWLAIAPTLHGVASAVPADPRPKLLVLAQHDEYRDAAEVVAEVDEWNNTEAVVIGGASHFFVGRYDRVVDVVREFVEGRAVSEPRGGSGVDG